MNRLAVLTVLTLSSLGAGITQAHDGPDPLGHWYLQSNYVEDNLLRARLGPDGMLTFEPRFVKDLAGESLVFEGRKAHCVLAADWKTVKDNLPTQAMTVSAWVSVDSPKEWGGLLGAVQDNGSHEKGWILGYDESVFCFGLSTTGADDGDGLLTYAKSTTPYEPGRVYHVVAVYDGKTTELYVNGEKEFTGEEQHGSILYPESAPFVIGAYKDANEFYAHHGRIREVTLYGQAATPEWVRREFEHHSNLASAEPQPQAQKFEVLVEPYLQFATQDSITVMWHTATSASSIVHYGETDECSRQIEVESGTIHEVRLGDLKPETQYFYKVESMSADGQRYQSPVATFKTAVHNDTPFAFAVISDTQGNPEVSGQLAQLAWGQRPSFVLHIGDLVSTGTNHSHWTEHFFPGMRPLINYVPFYPVLGNHEQNADHYYNYVSLPDPEYYYTFRFGNAQFFMIDSNQKIDPDSQQYKWLEKELVASTASWKIVCHHHPPYSSDENDYGNLWKTNQGTSGDLRARQLVPLYEENGVDIVWNGHIHSYERTWPIRKNKAVEKDAPFYMITGGGGGGLETPAPTRPFFQNNVRHGHHYVMVHINGGTLELKSFTLDDRLFDYVKLTKPSILPNQ